MIDGWYGFRVVDGKDVPHHPGAKPGMPCLTARCRTDAPYPDVEVVYPLLGTDFFRWSIGDPTFAGYLADRLEEARRSLLGADEPAVLGTLR
jgi:hypothetical protein